MRALLPFVLISAVACSPGVSTVATASASRTASERPSIVTSRPTTAPPSPVNVSPAPAGRVVLSNGPFDAAAPGLLFQAPGEETLRVVAWDGSQNGVISARVAGPAAYWHQSPDGSRYELNGTVYDRSGKALGDLPWPERNGGVYTWSHDSSLICKARPEAERTGSALRLEVTPPGGPARIVGPVMTFSDNAGYAVLACDPATDRALVASLGQGLFAGRLVVIRLSNGAIIRNVELGKGDVASWITSTPDGRIIAESVRPTINDAPTTTVRTADDGALLSTIAGFEARKLSEDGSLAFGFGSPGPTAVEVRDTKTGRLLWSAHDFSVVGAIAGRGGYLVVGVGTGNTSQMPVDVYLIGPDGARLLAGVRPASLDY